MHARQAEISMTTAGSGGRLLPVCDCVETGREQTFTVTQNPFFSLISLPGKLRRALGNHFVFPIAGWKPGRHQMDQTLI
jgi:hypothetical protein